MVMKKRVYTIIKLLSILSLLAIGLFLTNKAFFGLDKWHKFYNLKKDTLDVAHFGSSISYTGTVATLENEILQADSFNFSQGGSSIDHMKYTMIEMFKTQSPKFVILELHALKKIDTQPKTHVNFDGMRLSKNKYDAVSFNAPDSDIIEYLFPIKTHHLRWDDAEFIDEVQLIANKKHNQLFNYGSAHGYSVMFPIKGDMRFTVPSQSEQEKLLSNERMQILKDMAVICHKNDAKLIFIALPYYDRSSTEEIQMYINGLSDFAQQNDVDIISYAKLAKQIGLDSTDCDDEHHLNIGGAAKVSTHLASFIKETYPEKLSDMTWDYKEESQQKHTAFEKELENFLNEKEGLTKAHSLELVSYPSNMAEYLVALADKRYITIAVTKNVDKTKLNDDMIVGLKRIGIDAQKRDIFDTHSVVAFDGAKDGGVVEISKLPFELKIVDNSPVKIDGENMGEITDGFTFFVYDKALKTVVSKMNFDTNRVKQYTLEKNKIADAKAKGKVIYQYDGETKIGSGLTLYGYHGTSDNIMVSIRAKTERAAALNVYYETRKRIGFTERRMVRWQLITGENVIEIPLLLDEPIKNLKIEIDDEHADFLIQSVDVLDLE
jgi:hypothetical protein